MNSPLIPIAAYEDARLADRHAELLRTRGFTCELTGREVPTELGIETFVVAEIDLMVPEEQAEAAVAWLDALERTPLNQYAGNGDTLTLIGAFLAMVGLLVSFGDLPGIAPQARFLPYAIILIGGCLFLQGLMINRGDFEEEG